MGHAICQELQADGSLALHEGHVEGFAGIGGGEDVAGDKDIVHPPPRWSC